MSTPGWRNARSCQGRSPKIDVMNIARYVLTGWATFVLLLPFQGEAQTPAMAQTAEDFSAALSAPEKALSRGQSMHDPRGVAGVSADPAVTPRSDDYPTLIATLPRLAAMIHFETGSAQIHSDDLTILDALAEALQGDLADATLMVVGHVDSRGSDKYNQRLSRRRAQAVRNYLIAAGVASERLEARGYGERYPIAGNATAADRQPNRRSEFIRIGSL